MSIRLVIALRISHTVLPPPSILLITGARECHSKVHSPRRVGSSFRATICTRICGGELLTEPLDRRFLYTSTPRVSCAPRRRGKSGCRRRDRYLPLSEFPRRRPLARLCTRGQVCARAASYLYERHKKCDGGKCKREREWLREKERENLLDFSGMNFAFDYFGRAQPRLSSVEGMNFFGFVVFHCKRRLKSTFMATNSLAKGSRRPLIDVNYWKGIVALPVSYIERQKLLLTKL